VIQDINRISFQSADVVSSSNCFGRLRDWS
jgi:hypothetical protein